jgi:hypothetical protein
VQSVLHSLPSYGAHQDRYTKGYKERAIGAVAQRRKNGQQIDYFQCKKCYFLRSTDFKFLRKINVNVINDCDILNFIAPLTGGHFFGLCLCAKDPFHSQLTSTDPTSEKCVKMQQLNA